jgi:hypothetical protein
MILHGDDDGNDGQMVMTDDGDGDDWVVDCDRVMKMMVIIVVVMVNITVIIHTW